MRLLKFATRYSEPEPIVTSRVLLRRPESKDFGSWSELRRKSADFLIPLEPSWAKDELTKIAFKSRLRRHEADIAAGKSLPWFLFLRERPEILLGGLTISNIRRGVAETGTLGYWMGEEHAGKGYMKEALLSVCVSLFAQHRLHRIEAATVLENERSQILLRRCGFQQEGVARSYLQINGQWRDHILFARLSSDEISTDSSAKPC